MKRFTLYLVWLCGVVLSSAQAADPQTDKEKLSYALGAFFGQTVSRQDMELDIPAFLQAVEDVLSGAQTRLSGEQMQQILSDYQTREQQQRAAQDANWFRAMGLAKKTLTQLEIAVSLDPDNLQYLDDLKDYYRDAPGFLGGDSDKARAIEALIKKIALEQDQSGAALAKSK